MVTGITMSIDLDRIKAAADKLNKKRIATSTAAFCALYPSGKTEDAASNPCHYKLGSFSVGSECVISFLQESGSRSLLSEKSQEQWLEYLLQHSPYSSFFITKDAKEALDQEWVAISSDAPSNLLASALVCTRHLWEKYGCIQIYSSLIENDPSLNKNLAFLVATGNRYVTVDTGCQVSHHFKTEGHMPFAPNTFCLKDVESFISHKPVNPNPPYKEAVDYTGLDRLFVRNHTDKNRLPNALRRYFYDYIEEHYIYGEPPKDDDKLNIFKSVKSKIFSIGGTKYDTLSNFTNNITPILKKLEQTLKESNV